MDWLTGWEWNGNEIFKWGYWFYWSTSKLESKMLGLCEQHTKLSNFLKLTVKEACTNEERP